jgi:hypothetical protein
MATNELDKRFELAIKLIKGVISGSGNLKSQFRNDLNKAVSEFNVIFNKQKGDLIKLKSEMSLPTPSYAHVASTVSKENNIPQATHIVFIKSKDAITSEETKSTIKRTINPSKIGVGVKKMKNLSNGGVMIETTTKQGSEKLVEAINNTLSNQVEASLAKKFNPRLIIYNIPVEINEQNVVQTIIEQNQILHSETNCKEHITIKYMFINKKTNTRNIIIEVSPTIRRLIKQQNHLKMVWSICRVDDYVSILKCFKCCKFGHKSADCRGNQVCPICSGNHEIKDCSVSINQHNCANCSNHNLYIKEGGRKYNTKHTTMSRDCESFKTYKKMKESQINYE